MTNLSSSTRTQWFDSGGFSELELIVCWNLHLWWNSSDCVFVFLGPNSRWVNSWRFRTLLTLKSFICHPSFMFLHQILLFFARLILVASERAMSLRFNSGEVDPYGCFANDALLRNWRQLTRSVVKIISPTPTCSKTCRKKILPLPPIIVLIIPGVDPFRSPCPALSRLLPITNIFPRWPRFIQGIYYSRYSWCYKVSWALAFRFHHWITCTPSNGRRRSWPHQSRRSRRARRPRICWFI